MSTVNYLCRGVMAVAFLSCGLSLRADEYLLDGLITKNTLTWYHVDDQGVTNVVAAPADGCDLKVIASGGNPTYKTADYCFQSLAFDYTNAVLSSKSMYGGWIDANKKMTIGAGGVTMAGNNAWIVGCKALSSGADRVLVELGADQTWTGPAETPYSRFCVGSQGYKDYCHSSLKALEGVGSWTLDGRIEVFLNGSNELAEVDVTVNGAARLFLVDSYVIGNVMYYPNGRLGAKTLTVYGDGVGATRPNLIVGKMHDVCTNTGNTQPITWAPTAFDDATYAPVVTFDGDVVVDAGTAEYGLSRLNVRNGDATFGGDVVLTKDGAQIDIASGSSLSFTGTLANATGVAAALTVSGAGKLILPSGASIAGIVLDCATAAFSSGETLQVPVSGTGSVEFSGTGYTSVPAGYLAACAGGEIIVNGGTLVLGSVADLASGVKVRTAGEGALIVLDPTGFDKDLHMSGTKNLVDDDLVITEAAVENTTVSVGDGKTLKVFGSGLKASSTVTVADGGTIRFYRTASVFAPVNSFGGLTLATDANAVTGTLAGVFTATNTTGAARQVNVVSPGLLRLAGGGTVWSTKESGFTDQLDFQLVSGHAEIVDNELAMPAQFGILEGSMTLRDGGVLNHGSTYNTSRGFRLDMNQTGDARFAVAEGGELILGNNTALLLGRTSDYESRLVLDGGTITLQTSDAFRFNNGGGGKAVFEFNSGTFNTARRLSRNAGKGTAHFIWRGGLWRAPETSNSYQYNYLVGSDGIDVTLDGPCVIDMKRFYYAGSVISNAIPSATSWTVTENASLKVLKSDWAEKGGLIFRLAGFDMNNLRLDLNDVRAADVEIADAASPVAVTWTVPGGYGVFRAVGTSPALVASYDVPSGVAFEPSMTNGWHEGFSSVAMADLTFESGSALQLTTQAGGVIPVFEVPGTLSLPETMTCSVDRTAGAPLDGAQTVMTAAGGIVGDCVWTFAGRRMTPDTASMTVSGNDLTFGYKRPGFLLFLR